LVGRTTTAGETKVLGENLPQRHFVPPQIPHDQVRFRTPDHSSELNTLLLIELLWPSELGRDSGRAKITSALDLTDGWISPFILRCSSRDSH
jgi:hypothetical protein